MDRSDSAFRANAAYPTRADLEQHKREAHRLRAGYLRAMSLRLAISLDRLLRRAAARLAFAPAREAKPCR